MLDVDPWAQLREASSANWFSSILLDTPSKSELGNAKLVLDVVLQHQLANLFG